MMSDIFSRAARVCASVGRLEHDDGADLLFVLARMESSWSWIVKESAFHNPYALFEQTLKTTSQHLVGGIPADHTFNEEYVDLRECWRRFVATIRNFCCRPFFERLWIVQELCLASSKLLMCGLDTIECVLCLEFLKVIYISLCEINMQRNSQPWLSYGLDFLTPNDLRDLRNHLGDCPPIKIVDSFETHTTEAADILLKFRQFKCANPLDRVFGLRYLLRHTTLSVIVPNYKMTLLDLTVWVLDCMGNKSLDGPARVSQIYELADALGLSASEDLQALSLLAKHQLYLRYIQSSISSCLDTAFSHLSVPQSRPDLGSNRTANRALLSHGYSRGDEWAMVGHNGLILPGYAIDKSIRIDEETMWNSYPGQAEQQQSQGSTCNVWNALTLHSRTGEISLLCYPAQAGDFLLQFDSFYYRSTKLWLVIRHCKGLLYEIVGPAMTPIIERMHVAVENPASSLATDYGDPQQAIVESPSRGMAFELCADKTDLLAFRQRMETCLRLRQPAELLRTGFTRYRFSSFVLARPSFVGEKWACQPAMIFERQDRYTEGVPLSWLTADGSELLTKVLHSPYTMGATLSPSRRQRRASVG
jgi:hypothetical protein